MQKEKIKLGLIGNGAQMRREYLPYLEKRAMSNDDLEVSWASGCLCRDWEAEACPMRPYRDECKPGQSENWRNLLDEKQVQGIIISLPNALHSDPIREALKRGIDVAVDKPTTTRADECARLVEMAETNASIFVTLSQRRYEDVYQTAADIINQGGLGEPLLIHYMIAHELYDGDWQSKWSMSGGGVLISSGYHGIDTILWLLAQCPQGAVSARSVSARWRIDNNEDAVETLAVVRIGLNNGGIFNAIASVENPDGSLEEEVKIFGTNGVIRIVRDRPRKLKDDQSAARLSYQHARGSYAEYDTREWSGQRWAPLADFVDAVVAKSHDKPWRVLSPASDSLQTVKIIEKAYESASQDGREIEL